MNEAEWDVCANPFRMLEVLRGRLSDRKLRLFAVACCRRVQGFILDTRALDALAVAERFADGLVADAERSRARQAVQQAAQSREVTRAPTLPKWQRRAASAVYWANDHRPSRAAMNALSLAIDVLIERAGGYLSREAPAIMSTERQAQADMLRDLFGNPFRPPPSAEAAGYSPTVLGLARAIYEQGRFADLLILADALEEAGCTDGELLGHLRSPGPHVRGCWALDLILGEGLSTLG